MKNTHIPFECQWNLPSEPFHVSRKPLTSRDRRRGEEKERERGRYSNDIADGDMFIIMFQFNFVCSNQMPQFEWLRAANENEMKIRL